MPMMIVASGEWRAIRRDARRETGVDRRDSPLATRHSPLATRHSPLATRHSPLATHRSRPWQEVSDGDPGDDPAVEHEVDLAPLVEYRWPLAAAVDLDTTPGQVDDPYGRKPAVDEQPGLDT